MESKHSKNLESSLWMDKDNFFSTLLSAGDTMQPCSNLQGLECLVSFILLIHTFMCRLESQMLLTRHFTSVTQMHHSEWSLNLEIAP